MRLKRHAFVSGISGLLHTGLVLRHVRGKSAKQRSVTCGRQFTKHVLVNRDVAGTRDSEGVTRHTPTMKLTPLFSPSFFFAWLATFTKELEE